MNHRFFLLTLFSILIAVAWNVSNAASEDETEYNVYVIWGQTHLALNNQHPTKAAKAFNLSRWEPKSDGKPQELVATGKTRSELEGGDFKINFTNDSGFKPSANYATPPGDWEDYIARMEYGVTLVAAPVDDEGQDIFSQNGYPHFSMWMGHDSLESLVSEIEGKCGLLVGAIVYDENKNASLSFVEQTEKSVSFEAPDSCSSGSCSDDGGNGGGSSSPPPSPSPGGGPRATVTMPVGVHKGASGGKLELLMGTPANPLEVGSLLYRNPPAGVDVIRSADGALRQIRSSTRLVDITPSVNGGFTVRWYSEFNPTKNSEGLYDFTGAVVAETRVFPAQGGVAISSSKDGSTETSVYKSESNGELVLVSGVNPDGTGSASGTSVTVVESSGARWTRTKTLNPDGSVAMDELVKQELIVGKSGTPAWRETERTMAPDSAHPLIERKFYDTTVGSPSAGLVTRVESSDGNWTQTVYSTGANGPAGRVWKRQRPLGDGPEIRETELLYNSTGEVAVEIERAAGTEISRRTFTRTIATNKTVTLTEDFSPGGSAPLQRTVTVNYPIGGAPNAGRLWKTIRPDGTTTGSSHSQHRSEAQG